jgi:stage II sporulation protein D
MAGSVFRRLGSWALPALALPASLVFPSLQAQQTQSVEPTLRVLLLEQSEIRVVADEGLRLRDAGGRDRLRLPLGSVLALRLGAGGRVEALPPGGEVISATELWIEPLGGGPGGPSLWLEKRRYRGRIQIQQSASRLRAINHIGIETYLPSVVGSEMPASWPLEALRAQAVAARTYALRQRRASEPFDLKATVASQVYKGVEAESSSTRQATSSTRGLVLMHGNSLINAVFHSSAGGSTENSGDLWSRQMPYLVSVTDFDDSSPVSRWQQPLSPVLLSRAFAEIGGVRRIEVIATTSTGRVRQARVVGPSDELMVSDAELRSRLGLKSTLVRFEAAPFSFAATSSAAPLAPSAPPPLTPFSTQLAAADPLLNPPAGLVAIGRGFGHGVGMSQWGAFAMARRGESFDRILRHYYRGAELRPFSDNRLRPVAAGPADRAGSAGWTSSSMLGDRQP